MIFTFLSVFVVLLSVRVWFGLVRVACWCFLFFIFIFLLLSVLATCNDTQPLDCKLYMKIQSHKSIHAKKTKTTIHDCRFSHIFCLPQMKTEGTRCCCLIVISTIFSYCRRYRSSS